MEEQEQKAPANLLPAKYYLTNFNYVLDFVQEKYRPILQTNEWAFLRKYYCLSEDAQCLFVRLSNRRTNFFRAKTFAYAEIEDIEQAQIDLLERGFIEPISAEKHPTFAHELLDIFTKPELLKLFHNDRELKQLKKPDLVKKLIDTIDFQEIIEIISNYESIVKVTFEYEVAFLKFLFFGNRYLDMSEFVVRDLGYIQYYKHDDETLVARFDNRKDAEDKWQLTDQNELFKQLKETHSPTEIYDWFLIVAASLANISEAIRPSFDGFVLRVARFLEREKLHEEALKVYQLTTNVPSRERQVRTLEKLKNTEAATALCQQMLENPLNADEHFFANDFMSRMATKKTTKKSTTEELHLAESITVSALYKHQVELGTIDHYAEKGKIAVFAENHLWRAIFGLIFWDIIFDPTLVAFHHPFQRRPSDLHLPAFYEKRNLQIINHLDSFQELESLLAYMGQCYAKNAGTANPFVVWLEEVWDMARKAVELIGLENTKTVMHQIAKNMVENSRGFPDLLVWDEHGNYTFVEVKSPTDNLSNQQLYWLRFFKEIGINAKVLRVYFSAE